MKFHNILLTLLFTLSTPLSCQGQTDTTKSPVVSTPETGDSTVAVQLKPLDHPVEVGNSKPAAFKNTKANIITRATKLDAFFDTLTALKRPCRIVHIGDSHVRGHSYTPEARKVLENAWGAQAAKPQNIDYHTTAIATETGLPGLVYHAFGKNGATCAHFSSDEYVNKVKELKPDLIIISFGTNECHMKKYDTTAHKQELAKLVRRLSESCSEATIMLTTPGGAYLSFKSSYEKIVKQKNGKSVTKKMYKYTYKLNQHTPTCVKVITDYAKKKDLALWDMYAICGGKTSWTTNWYDNKLMKADHVHYTHNGYKVQGDLLAEAILNAYNNYIKRKQEGTKPTTVQPAGPKQKPAVKKPAPAKPRSQAKTPAKPAPAKPAATAQAPASKPAATTQSEPAKAVSPKSEPAKPGTTKPATAKPAATKPATTKPTTSKPAAPKPAATKPAAAKPATTKKPEEVKKQPAAGQATSTAKQPSKGTTTPTQNK